MPYEIIGQFVTGPRSETAETRAEACKKGRLFFKRGASSVRVVAPDGIRHTLDAICADDTGKKRPRDPNQLTKAIVDEAIGEDA
jgi:hypothetical protein